MTTAILTRGGTGTEAAPPPLVTRPLLLRFVSVVGAATIAAGVLVTFLPLAIAGRSAAVATAALFVQPASSTLARWAAGKSGTGEGTRGCCVPGSSCRRPAWLPWP